MFSIRLFVHIIGYISIAVLLLLTGLGGIITRKAIIIGGFLCLIGIWVICRLIWYLNKTNRRIQFSLESFQQIQDNINQRRLNTHEQELFYQTIIKNIPTGIISWADNGDIQMVNDKALEIIGLSNLKHINELQKIIPDLPEKINLVKEKGSVTININPTGFIKQIALSLTTITVSKQLFSILILTDIGRELSYKEFESWEKLTHVLTHEIMNTTAPILSLSGTLHSRYEKILPGQEEINGKLILQTQRGLESIHLQANRLLHFTESYRRLAYLQPPHKERFPVIRLLKKTESLLFSDFRQQGISFAYDIPDEQLSVYADESQLIQVLINLLKNALEATTAIEAPTIRIEIRQEKENVLIHIKDNGHGIGENKQEEIFVPFYTTKLTGSGIGLALSRQIIRIHGGELTVSSVPTKGSTFTIYLPDTYFRK